MVTVGEENSEITGFAVCITHKVAKCGRASIGVYTMSNKTEI